MRFKRLLITAVLFILPLVSWTDVHPAGSCSYAAVADALSAAEDGDSVVMPAGTATWSTTLVISKAIVLSGAGSTSTVVTASNSSTQLINISPGSNKPIRLTGIGFSSGKPILISGNKTNSYCLDRVRVDHCKFTDGMDNIKSDGWVEGLIDHNEFLNCNRAILVVGDNNYAWTRTIAAGTAHALFVEDNKFKQTNAGGGGLNENVYHWEGGRTVIRYNDFDGTEYTNYDFCPFDSHGNQGYYDLGGSSRGQPLIEAYNNTFRYHHTYKVCNFRGGSVLFHNNAFSFVLYSNAEIGVTEEEGWQPAFFNPLKTTWSAEDQIMNAFFWNNTRNGNPITDVSFNAASDSIFIQQNRDYFMHAPEVGGGKAVYIGRPGGAESFSAAGANAYYPYTPFVYPHPLQGSGGGAVGSPAGLRLKN